MEKNELDLNEAKRLIDIRTGKQKAISRYQTKLKEAQRGIEIDELIDDVTNLKDVLGNIKMEVQDPIPGIKPAGGLFFYKGKYLNTSQGELKKLSEAEAKTLLDQNSGLKVYFICSQAVCPMPGILSNKEKIGVKVKDDLEAAAYISKTSGIDVKVTDL